MIRKILVRSTNWIGDGVMTTPALGTLRNIFPEAQIDILVKPWVAPVFFHNPDIDNVIIYDKDNKHKKITERVRFLSSLKEKNYELGILFPNSFSSAVELKMTGCRKIIGYEGNLRELFLTTIIKRDENTRIGHEIFYYIKLLEIFKPKKIVKELKLFITEDEDEKIRNFIKRSEISSKWLLISPGAAYGSAKMWGGENFRKLAEYFHKEGVGIIISGGKEERELGEYIGMNIDGNFLNLAGRLSLREFFALVNIAPAFVSNDSGPMHIGAALNVPMVAIFGSTDVFKTGPWSRNAKVVRKNIPCSPCKKRECPLGTMECMNSITVEEVTEKIFELLK